MTRTAQGEERAAGNLGWEEGSQEDERGLLQVVVPAATGRKHAWNGEVPRDSPSSMRATASLNHGGQARQRWAKSQMWEEGLLCSLGRESVSMSECGWLEGRQ